MHRAPRFLMLTLLTLLAVVSWTATQTAAAPACTMPPQGEANSTTIGSPNSTSGGGSSSSNGTSVTGGRTGLDDQDVIATSWYPGWLSTTYPPTSIPWSQYNMMTFAFALTTADPGTIDLNGEAAVLKTFVQEAQNNGVKALLSIGGWTGSQHYSDALSNDTGRTAFTKAVTDLATQYNLDGIDFDWEYPNQPGIGCNTQSPNDSANFLTFLQQLRQDPVGSNLILTAAVGLKPFTGSDGTPVANASSYADVLDYIAIMNYDVWGSWSPTTGPNAPLQDSCAATNDQVGSAESAVDAWTSAQFPANQVLLGLASYGHSFFVTSTNAKTSSGNLDAFATFDKSQQPLGQGETSRATTLDQCGNPEGPSGVFYFNGLIDAGFLDASGNPGDGIDYTFDNCSQTPFVYNQSSQTFISFDDARSFAAKGNFINSKDLAGFAVWHVAGDSTDNILLNSLHTAMGISKQCSSDGGNSTTTAGNSTTATGSPDDNGDDGSDGSDGGSGDGGVAGSGGGGNSTTTAGNSTATASPDDGSDDGSDGGSGDSGDGGDSGATGSGGDDGSDGSGDGSGSGGNSTYSGGVWRR